MNEFKKEYTLSLQQADTLLKEIFDFCSSNDICFSIVNKNNNLKEIYIYNSLEPYKIQINTTRPKKYNYLSTPIIAIIGPDGVGKTTLFHSCKPHLKRKFIYKRFKKIVRRSIIYNLTYPFTKRILSSSLSFKPSKDQHDDCHPKLIFLAGLLYFPYLLFLANIKKNLIFIDRYFNDYLLENIAFKQKQTGLRKRWQNYLKLMPTPLMMLHLDAKEEVIHSRKDELTDTDIEQYRALNFFLYLQKPSKIYTYINTQNDIDFCKEVVLQNIFLLNEDNNDNPK